MNAGIYGKCSTPSCPHTEYCRGLCVTHYSAAVYQRNKARTAEARRLKRNAARRRDGVEVAL